MNSYVLLMHRVSQTTRVTPNPCTSAADWSSGTAFRDSLSLSLGVLAHIIKETIEYTEYASHILLHIAQMSLKCFTNMGFTLKKKIAVLNFWIQTFPLTFLIKSFFNETLVPKTNFHLVMVLHYRPDF